MTRMLNVVQQQRIASLASVNLVMREMVLPAKVSMYCNLKQCSISRWSYEQTGLALVYCNGICVNDHTNQS